MEIIEIKEEEEEEILSDNDVDPLIAEIMRRGKDDLLAEKSQKLYENDYNKDPPIAEIIRTGKNNSLPLSRNSKKKYLNAYNHFNQWTHENQMDCFSSPDAVVAALVQYVEEVLKPTKSLTTLMSHISMIRIVTRCYHNIDIDFHQSVRDYCQDSSNGLTLKPRKVERNMFTLNDMERFLTEAPDDDFLGIKATLIIGVTGVVKIHDLRQMTVDHLQDDGTTFKLKDKKNDLLRSISDKSYEILKKYISSRPKSYCPSDRLFLNYQKGKCTIHPIGKEKFSKIPEKIAEFLNLPNSNRFYGSAFSRSGVSLLIKFKQEALQRKSSSSLFFNNPYQQNRNQEKNSYNSASTSSTTLAFNPCTSTALGDDASTPICINDEPEQLNALEEENLAPLLFEVPTQPVTNKRKAPDTTSLTFNQCTSNDDSNSPQPPPKLRLVQIEKLKNNVNDNLSSSASLVLNKSTLNNNNNPKPQQSGKLQVATLPKLKTYSRGNLVPFVKKKPDTNLEPSAKIICSNGSSMSIQLNNCSNMKIYIVKE